MANLSSGAATFDIVTARPEYISKLIQTVATRCPLVTNYMKAKRTGGSRIEFFDHALPNGTVTVSASTAYTAGSGTITLQAPAVANPYKIIPGITVLATRASTPLKLRVTAWNPSTYVANVVVVSGTDATIAVSTVLDLDRSTAIGSAFSNTNDVNYRTSDYNYIENFNFELAIDNMHSEGRFISATDNELSFESQYKNNIPAIVKIMEKKFLRGTRAVGSDNTAQNGNTVQAGEGSTMGGILQAMSARGGIVSSSTSYLSEDFVASAFRQMDDVGAFSMPDAKVKSYSVDEADIYCSPVMLEGFNKLTRLTRSPDAAYGESQKIGGTLGTWTHEILAYGKKGTIQVSDAFTDNEILIVPKGKDLLELQVMRFAEEQPELNVGDAKRRLYATTTTARISNPWCLFYANAVVAP